MPEELARRAVDAYARVYGERPECWSFAPGRVEVLGNHTDYNGGFVLSVALDLGVAMAAGRGSQDEPVAEIWSEALGETARFRLDKISREDGSWSNYARGVLQELARAGVKLASLRLAVVSSLPLGAGVSSSAALELATAEAAYELFGGRPAEPMDEARLCQRAEVAFVGVPCGLLDQFSSLFGKKDHALFLDCDTLAHERLPLGRSDVRIVLAESGVKHALVDGRYADLRSSCERAAKRLAVFLQRPIRFLRDVERDEFERFAGRLDADERARAAHVIGENGRVLKGLKALRDGNVAELGRLMLASHASSRDLLGNSTPELDFLVAAASELPGFIGAKLCGGGFGGSTVNLVAAGREEEFASRLGERHAQALSRPLRTFTAGIGDGARAGRLEE